MPAEQSPPPQQRDSFAEAHSRPAFHHSGATAAAAVAVAAVAELGVGLRIPQISFRAIKPEPALTMPVAPVLHINVPVLSTASSVVGAAGSAARRLSSGSWPGGRAGSLEGLPPSQGVATAFQHHQHGDLKQGLWQIKREEEQVSIEQVTCWQLILQALHDRHAWLRCLSGGTWLHYARCSFSN